MSTIDPNLDHLPTYSDPMVCNDPKHTFEYKVTPIVLDGCRLVIETSDISRVLHRRILDLEDEATRAALIKLGWTPPGDSQWRPIETAPMDVPVLLWGKTRKAEFTIPLIGQWVRGRQYWMCKYGHQFMVFPTHWMPIPPAPEDGL